MTTRSLTCFSLSLILFSQSAWAALESNNSNDYYLGLSVQRDQNTSNTSLTASGNVASFFPPFVGSLQFYDKGAIVHNGMGVGVLAGFGRKFNCNLYIGLELQANDAFGEDGNNYSNLTFSSITQNSLQVPIVNTKITTKYMYAGSVRAGYFFWPTALGYIKLGVARGEFTVNTNLSDSALPLPSGSSSSTSGSSGFLAGVGVETSLTQSISLRLEYDYVGYEKINNNFTVPAPSPNPLFPVVLGDMNIQSSFTPHSNMLMASLVYHGNLFG